MLRIGIVFGLTAALLTWASGSNAVTLSTTPAMANREQPIKIVVETEPFTIGRRYRSMEGPEFLRQFSIDDLITRKNVILPASTIRLIENLSNRTPSKNALDNRRVYVDRSAMPAPPRHLYWFTGGKLDVLDEHGKVIPGAEFLCHTGIEVNGKQHRRLFPDSSYCYDNRIFTFTQGTTDMKLPKGYGVPLANTEKVTLVLKALNRTSDVPRRIRLKCTIYLIADAGNKRSTSALSWYRASVLVVRRTSTGGKELPSACSSRCCMSTGEDAPNDVIHWVYKKPLYRDKGGQELTGHWILPTGYHNYRTEITDHRFNANGSIRAVISHVHPFCQSLSLIELKPGKRERTLYTVHCRTSTSRGIRLEHIDYLVCPTPGIILDKNARYILEVSYNNTSGVKQDAMAVVIMLCSDLRFKKPAWAS